MNTTVNSSPRSRSPQSTADNSLALTQDSGLRTQDSGLSPFAEAHALLTQALQLLEAVSVDGLSVNRVLAAAERLITIRIALSVWSERPQPIIGEFEWRIIAGDFAALLDLLIGDRCAPIRALVSKARGIVATTTAQPAGVDVRAEGVR